MSIGEWVPKNPTYINIYSFPFLTRVNVSVGCFTYDLVEKAVTKSFEFKSLFPRYLVIIEDHSHDL